MGKSLGEIDALSAYELNQWMLYDRLYPFGDEREDWRMGQIAAAASNPHRGKGKAAFTPHDFMMKPPETQKQKEARLKAALRKASKPNK